MSINYPSGPLHQEMAVLDPDGLASMNEDAFTAAIWHNRGTSQPVTGP